MIVSSLLCAVLATRVAVRFEAAREKVVTEALVIPPDGLARFAIDPARSHLHPPFAVVATLRNDSTSPTRFSIRVDGHPFCDSTVPGGGVRRVDCAWEGGWDPLADHEVEVQGGAAPSALLYLELATHHGATRSYDIIIVPARSRRHTAPSPGALGIAFVVISLVFLAGHPPMRRLTRWIYGTVSVLVLSLLVLAVASPYVSPYLALVSPQVFWSSICVLAAPRLWVGVPAAWRMLNRSAWGALTASVTAGVLVLAVYGAVVAQGLHQYHGN